MAVNCEFVVNLIGNRAGAPQKELPPLRVPLIENVAYFN